MNLKSFIGISILIHLMGAIALYFYYNPVRIPPQPVHPEASFSNVPPEMRQGQWQEQGQRYGQGYEQGRQWQGYEQGQQWQGQGYGQGQQWQGQGYGQGYEQGYGQGYEQGQQWQGQGYGQGPRVPSDHPFRRDGSEQGQSDISPSGFLPPVPPKQAAERAYLQSEKEQQLKQQKTPPPVRQKRAKSSKKTPVRKKAQKKKAVKSLPPSVPPSVPKASVASQKKVPALVDANQPKMAAVKSPPVSSVRGVEGSEIEEVAIKQGTQQIIAQNLKDPATKGALTDASLTGSSVNTAAAPSASKNLPLGAAVPNPALTPPAVASAVVASASSPPIEPKLETSQMSHPQQSADGLQAKAQVPEVETPAILNREDMEEILPGDIEKEVKPTEQKQEIEDIEREEIEEETAVVAKALPINKEGDGLADPSVKLAAANSGATIQAAPLQVQAEEGVQAIVASRLPPTIRSFHTLKQKIGNPPLTYPEFARKKGMQGTVSVLFSVTEHGLVDVIELESSSGHSELDNFVLRAIARYEFLPGQGPSRVRYKIPFILEGEEVEYLRLRER